VPARVPRTSNIDPERLKIAIRVIAANGRVRAAAYMANIEDALEGMYWLGRMDAGEIIPTIENPAATKTLTAVIADAVCKVFDEGKCDVKGHNSIDKSEDRTKSA